VGAQDFLKGRSQGAKTAEDLRAVDEVGDRPPRVCLAGPGEEEKHHGAGQPHRPADRTMGTPASQGQLAKIARAIATYVDYQRELGVLGFPRSVPGPAAAARPAPRVAAVGGRLRRRQRGAGAHPVRAAGGHRRLPPLQAPRRNRTQVVFGVGNERARLVFVGEAPGHDEDVRGEPFVGRAGQLLTEIITKGMRPPARRTCTSPTSSSAGPPGNRNPEPDEVATCEPFLLRQLEIIAPEVIVALGKFAVQTLLRTKTPITQLRGRWHDYHGIRLMPTIPSRVTCCGTRETSGSVWDDILKVMGVLGIGGAPA